jgi:hypothetical protein
MLVQILRRACFAHDAMRAGVNTEFQFRRRRGFAVDDGVGGGSSGASTLGSARCARRATLLADARRRALPSFLRVPSSMASLWPLAGNE